MMFVWPVRVYYEDTDAGGVVFHANYLKFFERARTELLRSLGFELDDLARNHGTIFAVRSAQIDYLTPARFNEQLSVHSEITELKKVSFTFGQTITRNNLTLCTATIRIACVDVNSMRPKAIPENLLHQFKQ